MEENTLTARGPDRVEFVPYRWTDEVEHESDDVPFNFADNPYDGDDYTYDSTTRTEVCDQRYIDLAGRMNSLAARVAELERLVERWTANS